MIFLAARYWFPIKNKLGQVNLNLTWTLIFAFGLYTFGCSINTSFEELEKEGSEIEVIEFVKSQDKKNLTLTIINNTNTCFINPIVNSSISCVSIPKRNFNKLYLLYCQLITDKNSAIDLYSIS